MVPVVTLSREVFIMDEKKLLNRRQDERQEMSTEAELYLESSRFKAKLVNSSGGGFRMELENPISFHVRFKDGEKRVNRKAKLLWSMKRRDGDITYGFKYVDEIEK